MVKVKTYVSGRGTRFGLAVTFEPGKTNVTDSLRRSMLNVLIGRLLIRFYW